MQMDRACVSCFFTPSLFAIESALIKTLVRIAVTLSWCQMHCDCFFLLLLVLRGLSCGITTERGQALADAPRCCYDTSIGRLNRCGSTCTSRIQLQSCPRTGLGCGGMQLTLALSLRLCTSQSHTKISIIQHQDLD